MMPATIPTTTIASQHMSPVQPPVDGEVNDRNQHGIKCSQSGTDHRTHQPLTAAS